MRDPYPYDNPNETDQAVERRLTHEADARFDVSLEKPAQQCTICETQEVSFCAPGPNQCGLDVPGRR